MSKQRTAKVFQNGSSQAIRIPREFRFRGAEVWIRRDPRTSEVILTEVGQETWESFFRSRDEAAITENFLSSRDQGIAEERDWF